MPKHVPRLPPTVIGKSGALMMYLAAEVANPIMKTAYELPTPTSETASMVSIDATVTPTSETATMTTVFQTSVA